MRVKGLECATFGAYQEANHEINYQLIDLPIKVAIGLLAITSVQLTSS